MTGETPFSHRGMLEPDLGQSFAHRLVAVQAELVPTLNQVELVVCRVRVMALHAAPLAHGFMDAAGTRRHDGAVAEAADIAGFGREQLAVGRSVRTMAADAFAGLEGRVDERLLDLILQVGMAVQTELAVGSGLELELQGIVLGPDSAA